MRERERSGNKILNNAIRIIPRKNRYKKKFFNITVRIENQKNSQRLSAFLVILKERSCDRLRKLSIQRKINIYKSRRRDITNVISNQW